MRSLSIAALLLAGCATAPATTNTVAVPISIPCVIAPVQRPVYAIDSLPEGADLFSMVRALIASFEQQAAYSEMLEAAVASCQ